MRFLRSPKGLILLEPIKRNGIGHERVQRIIKALHHVTCNVSVGHNKALRDGV